MLWDIFKFFLKSFWCWFEFWGMNCDQICNFYLIYFGQVFVLIKLDGCVWLQFGQGVGGVIVGDIVKVSLQMCVLVLDVNFIFSILFVLIQFFLIDIVVFDIDVMVIVLCIVVIQEGYVLLVKGDLVYVCGDFGGLIDFCILCILCVLCDLLINEIFGYEVFYVGVVDFIWLVEECMCVDGKFEIVLVILQICQVKQEVGIGDCLVLVLVCDLECYVLYVFDKFLEGCIVVIYGDVLNVGQNQIVVLNCGKCDGVECGYVFVLWCDGEVVMDKIQEKVEVIKLFDECYGVFFVFDVYECVFYVFIILVKEFVKVGDCFMQF